MSSFGDAAGAVGIHTNCFVGSGKKGSSGSLTQCLGSRKDPSPVQGTCKQVGTL